MKFVLLCITVIPLTTAFIQRDAIVAKEFRASGLTPGVFPRSPGAYLNVYYPTAEVCLGEEIAQTRTILSPTIGYNFNRNVNYTLIILDPDSPSARVPRLQSYLVMLKVDITAEDQEGETIARYLPPSPYPGSGFHRYTIVLYEQSTPIDFASLAWLRLGIRRYRFDVVAFADMFDLGAPVAGNFFRLRIPAIYDEYYCTDCKTCPVRISKVKSKN